MYMNKIIETENINNENINNENNRKDSRTRKGKNWFYF